VGVRRRAGPGRSCWGCCTGMRGVQEKCWTIAEGRATGRHPDGMQHVLAAGPAGTPGGPRTNVRALLVEHLGQRRIAVLVVGRNGGRVQKKGAGPVPAGAAPSIRTRGGWRTCQARQVCPQLREPAAVTALIDRRTLYLAPQVGPVFFYDKARCDRGGHPEGTAFATKAERWPGPMMAARLGERGHGRRAWVTGDGGVMRRPGAWRG